MMATTGGADFIPRPNGEFDSWQKNFIIKAASFLTGWGIGTDGMAEWNVLQGSTNVKQARWTAAWAKVSSGQFTKADDVEMVAARKNYESGDKENVEDTSLRLFISRYVRNNKKVTVEQKSQCGLTVPKSTKTPTNPDTVKALTEAEMVISVKDTKHLLHVLKITQDKKSVAKGKGVDEISVYMALTASSIKVAPDTSAFAYDGAASRGLYTHTFSADQVDMRAWYITLKKYKGKTKKLGTASVATNAIVI